MGCQVSGARGQARAAGWHPPAKVTGRKWPVKRGKSTGRFICAREFSGFDDAILPCRLRPDECPGYSCEVRCPQGASQAGWPGLPGFVGIAGGFIPRRGRRGEKGLLNRVNLRIGSFAVGAFSVSIGLRPDVNVRAIPTKPAKADYQSPLQAQSYHLHDAFSDCGYSVPRQAGFSLQRSKCHIHPASKKPNSA